VAVEGQRLADAMALPYHDKRRDRLMDQLRAEVPDELIGEVGREAAGHLAEHGRRMLGPVRDGSQGWLRRWRTPGLIDEVQGLA
jgi:hypothetical protein